MSDADTAAAPSGPRRPGARTSSKQGQTYGFTTLFSDTVIYGAGRWLQKFLGLILLPLYTSFLTPFDYGILGLILTTQMVIDVIITFGWDVTFSRFYFDDDDESGRRRVITHTFYVDTIYPAGVRGLLAAIMPWLSKAIVGAEDWQSNYTLWFDIALLTLFFTNINDLPLQLFRLDHRPWHFFSFTMGRIALQVPLTIVLVAVLDWGVPGVLIGTLAAAFATNVASLPFYVRRLRFTWDAVLFKAMMAFAAANFLANVAFVVLTSSNRYLLRFLGSVTAVGLFTAAFTLAQPVYIAGYAFRLSWPQWHYSFLKDPARHKRRVARGFTYFVLMSAALVAAEGTVLPLVVRLALGQPAFWTVVPITLVLLIGLTLFNCYHLFLVGVNVTKKNRRLPLVVGIGAVISIAVTALLISLQGTMGAAWGTLISFGLLAVMILRLSQHYYPIAHEWSRIARITLAAALTLAVAYGVFALTGFSGQYRYAVGVADGGGTVSVSTDGGSTWEEQPDTVVASPGLVEVADGGATWSSASSTTVAAPGGLAWPGGGVPDGAGGRLRAASFPDDTHGWALDGAPAGDGLLVTADGGANWTRQPDNDAASLTALTFVSDTKGWAVGDAGRIAFTSDGGASWTDQTSGSSERLTSVTFVDAKRGWVVGGVDTVLQTTDAGATWEPVELPPAVLDATGDAGAALLAIGFSDADDGTIVAGGPPRSRAGTSYSLVTTTDGGTTWKASALKDEPAAASVSFLDLTLPLSQLVWRQALALLALPVFPLVLWLTRVFTPDEVRGMRSLAGRLRRRGRRAKGDAGGEEAADADAAARRDERRLTGDAGATDDDATRELSFSEAQLAREEETLEEEWDAGIGDETRPV